MLHRASLPAGMKAFRGGGPEAGRRSVTSFVPQRYVTASLTPRPAVRRGAASRREERRCRTSQPPPAHSRLVAAHPAAHPAAPPCHPPPWRPRRSRPAALRLPRLVLTLGRVAVGQSGGVGSLPRHAPPGPQQLLSSAGLVEVRGGRQSASSAI